MKHFCFLFCCAVLFFSACSRQSPKEFWIYTSIYKDVYPLYQAKLKKRFPDVVFRWYQAGSEKIAAKILAEQKGGRTRADMLLTADLFFFMDLKASGSLLPLQGQAMAELAENHRDPDSYFAISHYPLMVIAYHRDSFKEIELPKSLKDLADPKYREKLTMPSPLESGSALTTALYLHQLYGEAYFRSLRENEILASGGNGATLSRIQSGERPLGLVLLENVLKAQSRGQTGVDYLFPSEGALPVPAPIAALKSGKDAELANRVVNWFLSEEGQRVVVEALIYSPHPKVAAPKGAPAWEDIKRYPWNLATFEAWRAHRQDVKSSFQQIVLQ